MRVLQLIPSLSVGGAERIVGLLASGLGALGHEVHVVALGPSTGSFIEQRLREQGVQITFLNKGPGLDPRVLPRLARLLGRLRPEVVHTHLHTLKYLLLARPQGPHGAVLHTLHNLAEHEAEPHDRRVAGLAFRLGVKPVAIGEAVARSVQQVYGLPPAFTIPNGIPVADFVPAPGLREQVRQELGLPEGRVVLLSAGRLNPQKDPLSLVEAMAAPRLVGLDLELLIAGEGELGPQVEARIRALGLGARVRLLGVRRDIPRLMAAADGFVLASRYEGNPLVVMEAMAAGLAVLSTSVGCVPELVSAESGLLVSPVSVEALAEGIHRLASAPAATREMGYEGARRARERFDASLMAAAYARAFEEVRR